MVEQENAMKNEWTTKVTMYEQKITSINRESDQLKRRLQEVSEANRKLAEYENKIALMSQELQRLNSLSNEKSSSLSVEIENYRRRELELKSEIQRLNVNFRNQGEELTRIQVSYSEMKMKFEEYQVKVSGQQGQQYQKLLQAYNLVSGQY